MIHLYGLTLGLAIVIGIWLIEYQAKKQKIFLNNFYGLVWSILGGGILGARAYYVITNFYFYQDRLWDIFKIWQGGSSIIGGVIGGVVAAWIWLKINRSQSQIKLLTLLDVAVFGLPIAQSLGRWGNFVNQELYGLPTKLPWGIYIDSVNRLSGYEAFSYFHPLFLYESILMLVFALVVWIKQNNQKFSGFTIGSGRLFISYIFYYSFIRFWLDFIRIDKTHVFGTVLGKNQFFLILVMTIMSLLWFKKRNEKKI
jgi:phosphatidylglycerol---prolipoprotein diacylglyceryl transferase